MSIFDTIKKSYKKKLPFVVYRKPNKTNISGFFMANDDLFYSISFTESGFVFAPFDDEKQAVLFPLENAFFCEEDLKLTDIKQVNKVTKKNESSRKEHVNIVEKAIDTIHKQELEKVVLSRIEKVTLTNFDVVKTYTDLLQRYKNALVYVWYHPKVGLWLGATPEILLKLKCSDFKTMSLAGTQSFKEGEKVIWGSKELEEQNIVTQFIKSQLKDISTNVTIDETETFRAGSLLHLRTKVMGKLVENEDLKKLINALHPTPAVCGFPRQKAKDFILKNENYNRDFYTGFLGEINLNSKDSTDTKSHLFVNLRCMQIQDNTANIYVGGGITKDSIAENEWQETVNKTATMKVVLK